MKQIFAVFAVVLALLVLSAPTMAQSSNERGMELNGFFGQGNVSMQGSNLPKGHAFGGSFEYPLFQGDKFQLNSDLGLVRSTTKAVMSNSGKISLGQTTVGGGMLVYAMPKRKFRPFGGVGFGFTDNTVRVGSAHQTRNASGISIFGGAKLDLGKHYAIGARAGYVFSKSYGYDQYGNVVGQGTRGTQLMVVFTYRF